MSNCTDIDTDSLRQVVPLAARTVFLHRAQIHPAEAIQVADLPAYLEWFSAIDSDLFRILTLAHND